MNTSFGFSIDITPTSDREREFQRLKEDLGKSINDGRSLYFWYSRLWFVSDWDLYREKEPKMYKRTKEAFEYFLDQEWYEEIIILNPILQSLKPTEIICVDPEDYHDFIFGNHDDEDDDED